MDNGYYVMKVSEIKEAGIPALEDIEVSITMDVREEMRAKYIEDYCKQVYEKMQEGISLQDAVNSVTDSLITVEVKTEIVNRNYNITGLGTLNKLIAKVFTLENTGDNTGVVFTEKGSGIAVLLEKFPVDETKYEQDKQQLKTTLENGQKK